MTDYTTCPKCRYEYYDPIGDRKCPNCYPKISIDRIENFENLEICQICGVVYNLDITEKCPVCK